LHLRDVCRDAQGLLGILGGAYLPGRDPTRTPSSCWRGLRINSTHSATSRHSSLFYSFPERGDRRGGWSVVCWMTTGDNSPGQTKRAEPNQRRQSENQLMLSTPLSIVSQRCSDPASGKLVQSCACIDAFNLQPGNRVLQFASLSFALIFEMKRMARLAAELCWQRESLLPDKPWIHCCAFKGDYPCYAPPAVPFRRLRLNFPALQTIAAGIRLDIVRRWSVNRRFFNAYGPT